MVYIYNSIQHNGESQLKVRFRIFCSYVYNCERITSFFLEFIYWSV